MRYMVLETYKRSPRAVYERVETEEPLLFDEWIANWSDLVEFEIVPVINLDDAAARTARQISHGDRAD